MQVDPFSSVSAAHEIGENVSREIQRLHPEIAEVFVHIGTIEFSHICMLNMVGYFTSSGCSVGVVERPQAVG